MIMSFIKVDEAKSAAVNIADKVATKNELSANIDMVTQTAKEMVESTNDLNMKATIEMCEETLKYSQDYAAAYFHKTLDDVYHNHTNWFQRLLWRVLGLAIMLPENMTGDKNVQ